MSRPGQSFTAAELGEMLFDPLDFVCAPLIVPGATLLAGKPKTNKTWLMQEISLAVASGANACGEWKCGEGEVLFFALEDNARRLQRRMAKLRPKGDWPGDLTFQTSARRLFDGFEEDVKRWAGRCTRPRLVVIDTFNFIRPVRPKAQVSYQSDYADSAALTSLADELGLAIVAVHHMRKMDADDPLDGVSGTTGIAAGFDSIIAMSRSPDGLLKLEGRGRDLIPVEIALRFDIETARWTVEGDAATAGASDQRKAILSVVQQAGEASPKEIADRTGINGDSVRQLLGKMVRDGIILKAGYGSYTPAHTAHTDHTHAATVTTVSSVNGVYMGGLS